MAVLANSRRVGQYIVAAAILLSGFLLASCDSHLTKADTTTTSVQRTYAGAIGELHNYLFVWATRGPVSASREFLVPNQWVPSGERCVHLRHGVVLNYRPFSRKSNVEFTLLVGLNMQFKGWIGAYNQGKNDRLVTFTWSPARRKYLMEFNTGP
jgi:outer membrane murein-binding lipoprotein Lpp